MTDSLRGMPLLSGPPPAYIASPRAELSCRKCNKEFNVLFTRARRCNHCGYSYCSSCTDYQALMPRAGTESGYDPMPVCAFCIEMLNITAGGKNYLRTLSLTKLKRYVDAYGISLGAVLEKDDVVHAILAARDTNGCLPRAKEEYYRKHSVPNGQNSRPRGLFSRRGAPDATSTRQTATSQRQNFARPDLTPDSPRQYSQPRSAPSSPTQQNARQSRYNPPSYPPPPESPGAPRMQQASSGPYRPRSNHNMRNSYASPSATPPPRPASSAQQRTRATSAAARTPPPPPPPPPPSIDELLNMSDDTVSHLSVGVLKAVLDQNHVNARLMLEKSDLVARVMILITEERHSRERDAAYREQDELEALERQRLMEEQQHRAEQHSRNDEETEGATSEAKPDAPPKPPVLTPESQARAAALERNGLCVVCQDEDANIAIVDCGHLALCLHCSDLIMKTTQECPLCRTRIVTDKRLLRIFKT